MAEYKFRTPLKERDMRKLRVGDLAYVSGIIYSARDMAHGRLLKLSESGRKPPVRLEEAVVYHAGPLVQRWKGRWKVISAGPTTSFRMNKATMRLLEYYSIRMIVGKGGMSGEVAEALKKRGAVYCHYPGGAAVLAAEKIRQVVGVEWLDLGIPEALWVLEVEDFGPLLVTMDARGGNLYEEAGKQIRRRLRRILAKLA
ncbi:TPA: fumarate hydratase [Candidatus Bathyarchaeota archaeon]|nr:fumarate hydratase [Candidatus Bathyarchaeota archaeon]